jgi:hypothetical protein
MRKLECKAVTFKEFLGVGVFYWEYREDSGSNCNNKHEVNPIRNPDRATDNMHDIAEFLSDSPFTVYE